MLLDTWGGGGFNARDARAPRRFRRHLVPAGRNYDQAHLSSEFRALTGWTPREYAQTLAR
ncbi:MAG: AraC family transcriptional regulator [Acidobacteria bacterium]|nr:MAG: AraC family transcriptional regulator [Acidobacteriota bacterium]